MGRKVGFDFGEVVGVASAVSIEADDRRFKAVELVEAMKGFVHADFAGEADAGVFAGQVWGVEEMDAERAVAIFAGPEFGFGDGAAVLFEDFGRGGFVGVDDDDDFQSAFRTLATPEGIERGEEVRFVVAGNDDDHSEARVWWVGDERWERGSETEALEVIGCGG